MDTRFSYTAGAGITAAYNPSSVGQAPTRANSEEDGYVLIERSGYQRGDYILSVIVDCSRLPQTERSLVFVGRPNEGGDPEIYFVPGVGVSAREDGGARSASVPLPVSGFATVTYTILRSKGIYSLDIALSTGGSRRVDAQVNWATGANSAGHLMALMHKSVVNASFFWSD
jgi:hypothetical protein